MEHWDCEPHGAGGSGSADLLVGVGSSYTGCPVEIGCDGIELSTWERGEEDGGVEGGREVSEASDL